MEGKEGREKREERREGMGRRRREGGRNELGVVSHAATHSKSTIVW